MKVDLSSMYGNDYIQYAIDRINELSQNLTVGNVTLTKHGNRTGFYKFDCGPRHYAILHWRLCKNILGLESNPQDAGWIVTVFRTEELHSYIGVHSEHKQNCASRNPFPGGELQVTVLSHEIHTAHLGIGSGITIAQEAINEVRNIFSGVCEALGGKP